MRLRVITPLALLLILLAGQARAQITFSFDFTHDTHGFFTGANAGRQTYLTAAAQYAAQLIGGTTLSAITPAGSNTWTATIFDPSNFGTTIEKTDLSIAANTIVVYAGGYEIGGSTLGIGGTPGVSTSGVAGWHETVTTRGNGTYRMASVGSITFNSTTNWYFDNDITTVETFSGQADFFSVAVHELLHMIGFGTSSSWTAFVSGSNFTGPNSVAANGGLPVPLHGDAEAGYGHWADGTMSTVVGTATAQEALMDPTILNGTRKYATTLDMAGLMDIGYSPASAIPESGATALWIGVVMMGVVAWRRPVRRGGAAPKS